MLTFKEIKKKVFEVLTVGLSDLDLSDEICISNNLLFHFIYLGKFKKNLMHKRTIRQKGILKQSVKEHI